MKNNILTKGIVYATALASIGMFNGGCASSMYSTTSDGIVSEKKRISISEDYHKNLVRNYTEAVQTTMPQGSDYQTWTTKLTGAPKVIKGVNGLVKAMQKERVGDGLEFLTIAASNALVLYLLLPGSSSGSNTTTTITTEGGMTESGTTPITGPLVGN